MMEEVKMKSYFSKLWTLCAAVALVLVMSGCERIATGEVGLREAFNKTIEPNELRPGSLNQVLVGSVLVFPVKQIGLPIENLKPQTADHSTLDDLDIQVIYNLNPAAVYDLYTVRSHSFNAIDTRGDTLLMYNYLSTVANSAAFKSINKYKALDVAANRSAIENDIAAIMREVLKAEGLDTAITIDQVQVKNILPAKSIIDSANAVITAQNAQNAKQVEVGTARLEAERAALLSKPANLEYMKAQANLNISEGIRDGKVNTIVVPSTLTMLGSLSK
jgi:regulator of protease activity HflC (stomatin/prohibitin superfamily)